MHLHALCLQAECLNGRKANLCEAMSPFMRICSIGIDMRNQCLSSSVYHICTQLSAKNPDRSMKDGPSIAEIGSPTHNYVSGNFDINSYIWGTLVLHIMGGRGCGCTGPNIAISGGIHVAWERWVVCMSCMPVCP